MNNLALPSVDISSQIIDINVHKYPHLGDMYGRAALMMCTHQSPIQIIVNGLEWPKVTHVSVVYCLNLIL